MSQLLSASQKQPSVIGVAEEDEENGVFDEPKSARFSVASEEGNQAVAEEIWALDAKNGFLSHSKMQYVRNMRQVRSKEALAVEASEDTGFRR